MNILDTISSRVIVPYSSTMRDKGTITLVEINTRYWSNKTKNVLSDQS